MLRIKTKGNSVTERTGLKRVVERVVTFEVLAQVEVGITVVITGKKKSMASHSVMNFIALPVLGCSL